MAKTKDTPAPEVETKAMTKAAAVREALVNGVEKPQDGVEYLKTKHGLDITANQFSIYKSAEKKKGASGGTGGTRGRKPNEAPKETETRIGVSSRAGTDSGVALAREVKALVEKYGANSVKDMADVFAG